MPPETTPDPAGEVRSGPARPATLRPAQALERLAPGTDSEGKTLTIPRSISYSGRIGSCERLIVEGAVETELSGCRLLLVAAGGVFRGSADVETADIRGTVEGPLTVRETLTVRASGRIVAETIACGEIEVERGATIAGAVRPLEEESE
ncbi:MAG: polymer-forming cytoskeletal protein [Defluviicoccus sp.]|nr:polymer-forming cytoskeletal protein [Defluviicoccus sp.]